MGDEGKRDLFENKSVAEAVVSLALPSVMGQIILVIYNMADTLFVGMTGSDAMITAVTVCMPAFMFLSAISNLFGVGGASVIARGMGKGNWRRSVNASSFAIWGCLVTTLAYCGGVCLFMDSFVDLLGGTDAAVHENAREYMLYAVAAGGTAAAMGTLMSHLVRAYGYSVSASAGVAVGGVLNVALDPLFMFVVFEPGNEARGAAVATAISNLCALMYYVAVVLKNRKKLLISFRPSAEMFGQSIPRKVLRVGVAACLMTLCENISYAILDKLMVFAGTAAQAGIGVAKKVNMLAHCFVRGMSQGVLPLIAYNYALGNRSRMKKVVYVSAMISIGISLACLFACRAFSVRLVSAFIRTDGESLAYGAKFLMILCLGAPFSSFAYTVISFFQATGKGARSLMLALLRKGVLDIPLMFALFRVSPVYGIVWATPIADVACCAVAAILFAEFLKRHGNDKASFATSRVSGGGQAH